MKESKALRFLARIALLLVLLDGTSVLAEDLVHIVIANRHLNAGETLTYEDLTGRRIPRHLVTTSMVTVDSAAHIINQTLLHPVDISEPFSWSYFATGGDEARAPCPPQPTKQRASPPRPKVLDRPPLTTVLVATRDLAQGTVLAKEDLGKQVVEMYLASRYAAQWSEASLVVGQKLLAPRLKNDIIYFTQLADWADPKRCQLQFEAGGNLWATKPPPAAEKTTCPKLTRRIEGVPGGEKGWNPSFPGWVVTCLDKAGRRHGPFVGFDRLSERIVRHSEYHRGKPDSRFDEEGARPIPNPVDPRSKR